MTTALQKPANWYPDPSGRADARYWDGRMWTAHVVRGGVAALDQIDGIQQPRQPTSFTHAATPTDSRPAVGHGTRALQEIATPRRARPRSPAPGRTAEPRISTRGAIAVFLVALLVVGVGVYFFRKGVFTVDATPERLRRSVTVEQPDYRVTIPDTWLERATTGSLFDAVYSVPDRELLNIGIVDFVDASLSDATVRDEHLALASDMVATAIGPNPSRIQQSTVKVRERLLHVATYDVGDASGLVTRLVQYQMVGPDRAVIVAGYGTPAAVERHLDAIAKVARTSMLT